MQSLRNAALNTLEVLDISDHKIDKIASQAIVFVMENSPCLRSLNLAKCHISPDVALVLLNSVANNADLRAVEIDLSENELGVEGASAISKVLPSCHNVATIKLKANNFQKDSMLLILRSLTESRTIRGVDLSQNLKYNSKNGEVLKALADLISQTQSLETLIINGAQKTHLGRDLVAVFQALAVNKTVTFRATGFHFITVDCLGHFVQQNRRQDCD
jgi:Ran GTPase-activating protein (RanGAP) involved in mRNA processing and transport